MTKSDDGDPARIAELELENVELKERLAQREHDAAEIADAYQAAKHDGGGSGMQANTWLAVLWGLIVGWLLMWHFVPVGTVTTSIVSILALGFSFIVIGKWLRAERSNGWGVVVLKCLVFGGGLLIGLAIIGEGPAVLTFGIVSPDVSPEFHEIATALWMSFVFLVLLSRLCEFLARQMAAFIDDPLMTVRGWFARDTYDGQRED
jgi:hypothetical protein